MTLIAHRGAPNGRRPENSMSAFHQALTDGFRHLEFDLRLTLDEKLLVLHDDTLKRTCEVRGRDAKASVQWMEAERVQSYSLKGSSEHVPAFEQLLDLLSEREDLILLPELKDHSPRAAERFLELVAQHPHRDRIVVQSFQHLQLHFVAENSDLKVCPLYRFRPESVDELPCEWEAPMAEGLLWSPGTVADIHRRGRKVAAWFFFLERWSWLRRRMQKLGVDALMVDTYPES